MSISDFIENYNRIEDESIRSFSNYLVRAFAPITFNNLNFQTDIKSQNELWKYIDTQHEGRYFENMALLGGGITESEFELLQEAVDICMKFTKTIGKELIPINALTRSLISYRAIKSYFTSLNKAPSVLEIGAGSGYLGLLCGISGWWYSSLDVSKSLVTYQNTLWNFAGFKVKFAEVGVTYSDSNFLQIPWWVWCNTESPLPNREIVVANHVIQEMAPLSLSFTIRRSRDLSAKYITAEGLGDDAYKNNLNIINRNTVLIHNGVLKHNYQKVWLWKIKNEEAKVSVGTNSIHFISKSKKQFLINILLNYKFSAKLYRKINQIKARKLSSRKTSQLLNKALIHPSLIFNSNTLNDFLISKKVPLMNNDELIMRWANHTGHI